MAIPELNIKYKGDGSGVVRLLSGVGFGHFDTPMLFSLTSGSILGEATVSLLVKAGVTESGSNFLMKSGEREIDMTLYSGNSLSFGLKSHVNLFTFEGIELGFICKIDLIPQTKSFIVFYEFTQSSSGGK